MSEIILTGLAVFVGSICGGIVVAEYTMHRGKNMIRNGINDAIKSVLPQVMSITELFMSKLKKEKPDDYE